MNLNTLVQDTPENRKKLLEKFSKPSTKVISAHDLSFKRPAELECLRKLADEGKPLKEETNKSIGKFYS
jgi:hypothetical protein